MAGTVRKRVRINSNGETRTTWFADYYTQDGKRHRRSFAREKAAHDWLDPVRIEVKAGIHTPDAQSIKFKEAAEIWLQQCARDGLERGTIRVYEQYVRLWLVPYIGEQKLSRLTAAGMIALRDVLLTKTSRQRVAKILSTVRLILKEMQPRQLVAQNVAAGVKVKSSKRGKRKLAVGVDLPSPAEVQAMLAGATGRERVRFVTLALTGLRTSELRALAWADVDFDGRLVHVSRRADWWGALGPPKTENGQRSIPLSPIVVNTLKKWRLAAEPGCDLVFPGRDGRVVSHTTVQTDFDAVQIAAGVVDAEGSPKYALHALRHFFASWGIKQGFHAKRLQELLGHGSIQLTYDVYGHWLGDIEDDHTRLAAGEAALFGLKQG
jgi:integrase